MAKLEFFQPTEPHMANGWLQRQLIERCGGFTAFPAMGSWKSASGKVIQEPIEVLTAYGQGDLSDWADAVAVEYCRRAEQEAVFYVLDGVAKLVQDGLAEQKQVA